MLDYNPVSGTAKGWLTVGKVQDFEIEMGGKREVIKHEKVNKEYGKQQKWLENYQYCVVADGNEVQRQMILKIVEVGVVDKM